MIDLDKKDLLGLDHILNSSNLVSPVRYLNLNIRGVKVDVTFSMQIDHYESCH